MQNETSRLVEFEARVVVHHRDRYVLRTNEGDRDAVLAGRFRHVVATVEELPAVGDWVDVVASSDGESVAQIVAVRPRRSAFIRKTAGDAAQAQVLAANVDVALITAALPADVNPRRIERLLTLAWESGATPIVVLTKRDLCRDDDSLNIAIANARAVAVGVDVLAISTHTGDGLDALEAFLVEGVTAVVLGSSGDGKSTLVNALLGEARQRTWSTRGDGAGRHTTTHRELFELAGGASIIDTPGLREVQLWSADGGISAAFDDIASLAAHCRFGDCAHEQEPDCRVLEAVTRGALDAARLESWRALNRELAYLERKLDVSAAQTAKSETKSLMRAQRSRLRDKYE